jgi:hypothetical protein
MIASRVMKNEWLFLKSKKKKKDCHARGFGLCRRRRFGSIDMPLIFEATIFLGSNFYFKKCKIIRGNEMKTGKHFPVVVDDR